VHSRRPASVCAILALAVTSALGACSGGGGGSGPSAPVAPPGNLAAPVVAYGSVSFTLEVDEPITPIVPTSLGGQVASWSIEPALPAGVVLGSDGVISGSPAVTSAPVNYVVTARNSAGSGVANLALTVSSTLLLDLGHADEIAYLDRDGERLLSLDVSGRWVLWNTENGKSLARGTLPCGTTGPACGPAFTEFADLAGGTLALRSADSMELRSASDGKVLTRVSPRPPRWKLATDGSYIALASATELATVSSTGMRMLSRSGNYTNAMAFAAPAELRVARGAAGTNVIERIAIPTGAATTSSFFEGTFHSWFLDGERFLANDANTVRVYSRDAALLDVKVLPIALPPLGNPVVLPGLAGRGDWFWTFINNTLDVYDVGASATPTASYALGGPGAAVPSGATIGLLAFAQSAIGVVDLAAATPTNVSHAVPVDFPSAYAVGPRGEPLVGNRSGVVVDLPAGAAPRYLAFGAVDDIAGAANRAIIAVASAVLYYDVSNKSEEGRIESARGELDVSDDAALLLALGPGPARPLVTFALPSEAPVATFPYAGSYPQLVSYALAGSGSVLGRVEFLGPTANPSYRREVSTLSGTVRVQDTLNPPVKPNDLTGWFPSDIAIRLSPDGMHVAVATRERHTETVTKIYTNGLMSVVDGWPVGWLDDQRLLVNRYAEPALGLGQGQVDAPAYASAVIVNALGQVLDATALPELTELQRVGPDKIYSRERNTIYSMPGGSVAWTSSRPIDGQGYPGAISNNRGAVAGNYVVFVSGAAVRAEVY